MRLAHFMGVAASWVAFAKSTGTAATRARCEAVLTKGMGSGANASNPMQPEPYNKVRVPEDRRTARIRNDVVDALT